MTPTTLTPMAAPAAQHRPVALRMWEGKCWLSLTHPFAAAGIDADDAVAIRFDGGADPPMLVLGRVEDADDDRHDPSTRSVTDRGTTLGVLVPRRLFTDANAGYGLDLDDYDGDPPLTFDPVVEDATIGLVPRFPLPGRPADAISADHLRGVATAAEVNAHQLAAAIEQVADAAREAWPARPGEIAPPELSIHFVADETWDDLTAAAELPDAYARAVRLAHRREAAAICAGDARADDRLGSDLEPVVLRRSDAVSDE